MLFLSLPDETLLHIFKIVINDGARASWTQRQPVPVPVTLVLSQIASFARTLVQNAPLLWTTIDDAVLQHPAFLRLYIHKSRQCLLDIYAVTWDDEKHPRVMPLLAHVDRWHVFHLTTTSMEDYRLFAASFTSLRLPKLEDLDISCYDNDEPSDDPTVRIFTGGTPALKQLELYNISCFPSTCSAITHLNLQNMPFQSALFSYSEFVRMLSSMPSLAYLCLIGNVVSKPNAVGAQVIDLPRLKSFKLIMEDEDDYEEQVQEGLYDATLLPLFTSTQLKRLYLHPAPSALEPILDGMRRRRLQFPHVTKLYWGMEIDDEDDALDFIQSFPAVESLVFADISGATIIEALIASPDGHDLWRNMHTVDFRRDDVPLARRLVQSRINVGRPLVCVRLRQSSARSLYAAALGWMGERVRVELFVSRRDSFDDTG